MLWKKEKKGIFEMHLGRQVYPVWHLVKKWVLCREMKWDNLQEGRKDETKIMEKETKIMKRRKQLRWIKKIKEKQRL